MRERGRNASTIPQPAVQLEFWKEKLSYKAWMAVEHWHNWTIACLSVVELTMGMQINAISQRCTTVLWKDKTDIVWTTISPDHCYLSHIHYVCSLAAIQYCLLHVSSILAYYGQSVFFDHCCRKLKCLGRANGLVQGSNKMIMAMRKIETRVDLNCLKSNDQTLCRIKDPGRY